MRIATVHFGPHVRARACDFNRHALPLLWWFARHLLTVVLRHFDILEDNDIRQGLKTFSNWPTYPQLYVEGKLIGGLDIMQEMHEDDELADLKPAASTG